jgi:energy-converting hydrogenase Eha subunit G
MYTIRKEQFTRKFKLEELIYLYVVTINNLKICSIGCDDNLTLILPGEVNVDLANFDIKFRTILIYGIFLKLTYSCSNVL